MEKMQEIKQAIRQLSRVEREDLAEWILNSADFGDRVAEAAMFYGDSESPRHLSVEEYLRREEDGLVRHEYVAGEIFAMSGAMMRHNVIAGELFRHFNNHLHGGSCRAYSPDMKIRLQVNRDEIFYYPDVSVACGPQNMESTFLRNPCLIVEVLSPSTQATDRREKRLNYRHISSLEEYVLVSQQPMQVVIYRRSDEWAPQVLTSPEAVAEFRAIGFQMTLESIYEGTQ